MTYLVLWIVLTGLTDGFDVKYQVSVRTPPVPLGRLTESPLILRLSRAAYGIDDVQGKRPNVISLFSSLGP